MLFYAAAVLTARRHRRNDVVVRPPQPSLLSLFAGELTHLARRLWRRVARARDRVVAALSSRRSDPV